MLQFTSSERNKFVRNSSGYEYTFKRKGFTTNEWRCRPQVHYHSVQIIPSLFDLLHVPSLHASKQIIDEVVQRMKNVHEKRQLLFQRYMQKNLFVHALQIPIW